MRKRVLSVFGTRPEAIKMAPVVRALEESEDCESVVCVTGQHRQMLDQVLQLFNIEPDHDLDIMREKQDLFDVTASSLLGLRSVLRADRPDIVLVQGDTTTCFTAALAAFYERVAVGHVEAGLRTGDLTAPYPEEANRALVSRIARFHFPPTESARQNLLKEAISDERIWVTGNTVIDALLMVRDKVATDEPERWQEHLGAALTGRLSESGRRLVVITGHRRESFGPAFRELCAALKEVASRHPECDLVYPVHLNPNVREPVLEILSGLENVFLIEPLGYAPFVWLMDRCDAILTDSGGIQEEAPSLGKPVLVLRDVTERPEAVEAGTAAPVGTERRRIVSAVEGLLANDSQAVARDNPYGDGRAAKRIVRVLAGQAL
jgi:UDP-N-acetylglucosamine 2-epimerase (non-hydrolysing)